MKAVAVIPARGGSKRIPKKNIIDFFGKPLIAYSIQSALKSELFDEVIVSTDDEEIAKVAKQYGARVPFIRPKHLSDDLTHAGVAVSHVLDFLAKEGKCYQYCCTIYATAPLLHERFLKQAYEKLKNSNAKMAFSVALVPYPVQRTFKIDEKGRCEMFMPQFFNSRSQDLDLAYHDAGQFYFENLQIQSTKIAFSEDSIAIVLPNDLVQDLDTLQDFEKLKIKAKNILPLED